MSFSSIGVVGSGPLGCAIAIAIARTEVSVLLVRAMRGDAALAARRIESRLRYFLDAGEITEDELERAREGIRIVDDLALLAPCDLVIESVPGDDLARRAVLATLESRLSPGAVLASNSAPEDLSAIAEVLRRRDQFVGLRFFASPLSERAGARTSLPSASVVELSLLVETAPGVAAACKAFARSLGTTTIEHSTGVAHVGYREFLSGEAAASSSA
ncbi:MAG: 3-hydroxyacyl-CoA dehydrogenase NAD-binding domain-containing protein [Sandaracinus sp.]